MISKNIKLMQEVIANHNTRYIQLKTTKMVAFFVSSSKFFRALCAPNRARKSSCKRPYSDLETKNLWKICLNEYIHMQT